MEALKINQFYDYKFLSNVRWSPDGNRAVFCAAQADAEANEYKYELYLFEKGDVRPLGPIGKDNSFFWEDDTHVLFPAVRGDEDKKRAEGGDIFTSFYRLSVEAGEAEKAFELPMKAGELKPAGENRWFFTAPIDHKYPDFHLMHADEQKAVKDEIRENEDYITLEEWPFWHNGGTHVERERNALFVYEPAADESCGITRITERLFDVASAVFADGCIWYTGCKTEGYAGLTRLGFFCYDLETCRTRTITEPGEWFINSLFVLDNTSLIVCKTRGNHYSYEESADFWLYDTVSGEEKYLAVDRNGYFNTTGSDCRLGAGYEQRAYGGKLYYISTVGGTAVIKSVDRSGNIENVTGGEGSVDCFDINRKGELLAVAMLEGRLQELYVLGSGKLNKVSSFNDEVLDGRYVAPYEHINIKSRGYSIDGWVLKPINYDPHKTYPAILDIHGGPRTAYGQIFFHEMQYWAGLGYFVFFCNPFGSDGKGDAFADLRGKYGTIDFINIMDFTDEVLHRYPQIDEQRVAVTGGSYGGFMTNWIIGHTDRFCCAATQRSISNWISFYGVSDIGTYFAEHQLDADVFFSADHMWQQSPLAYAQNFKTPTLIIHSDADYRCPISEGYQLYTALMEQGIPARMVVFKGENHELSRSGKPKHRLRRLTEISEWFEKYCK